MKVPTLPTSLATLLAVSASALIALSTMVLAEHVPADLAELMVVPPDSGRPLYFSEPGRRTLIYFQTATSRRSACPGSRADVSGVWITDFGADVDAATVEYRLQRDALHDSALFRQTEPLAGVDEGETSEVEAQPAGTAQACRKARHEELFRIRGVVVFVTQDHYGAFDAERGIAARIRARLARRGGPTN